MLRQQISKTGCPSGRCTRTSLDAHGRAKGMLDVGSKMDPEQWAQAQKVINEVVENYIRRKKQEHQAVIRKAEEIAQKKKEDLDEEEQVWWETLNWQFELMIEEYWRPCPYCEKCPESGYGSFEPPWDWCKKQREKRRGTK